jgi:hypothetical protein
MNEQSLTSVIDENEENSINYKEFYGHYEHLLDTTNKNSSSTMDNNSLIPTHTILPFMIKSNSAAIFSIEQKN